MTPLPNLASMCNDLTALRGVGAPPQSLTERPCKEDRMADKALPPVELLRQLLRYEPETGKLFWLPRGKEFFPSDRAHAVWNARYAGQPALNYAMGSGYLRGSIFGVAALAHRAAWALHHGVWPEAEIDHKNGIRSDNRLENLRPATRAQNAQNVAKSGKNSSGFHGVCWDRRTQKWMAHTKHLGKFKNLGRFDRIEDAARAAQEGRAALHTFSPRIRACVGDT